MHHICLVHIYTLQTAQMTSKMGLTFREWDATTDSTSDSVSVCDAATLGSLEFSTSLCCCMSNNSSCIWPMPPTSSSNLHSNVVMELVPSFPWDWSVESSVSIFHTAMQWAGLDQHGLQSYLLLASCFSVVSQHQRKLMNTHSLHTLHITNDIIVQLGKGILSASCQYSGPKEFGHWSCSLFNSAVCLAEQTACHPTLKCTVQLHLCS